MGDNSAIEWTHATWNPITGCTKVSPGCKNCYAERVSLRLKQMGQEKYRNGFELTVHEDDFDLPLRWKQGRMIFVNSMSDLFHEKLSFSTIEKIYDVMKKAPQHIYQILTKRPERMAEFFKGKVLPSNIWVGTSVELQMYCKRLIELRKITAIVRFVSFEPLLGPVYPNLHGVDWAIVGGESGPGHRSCDPEWVRSLRDECVQTHVPFFFKQWGGPTPKSGGRLLDGRTWDEFPGVLPTLSQYKALVKPKKLDPGRASGFEATARPVPETPPLDRLGETP